MPPTDAATLPTTGEALATLTREYQLLRGWLLNDAYPLWATQGYDRLHGGFEDSLTAQGPSPDQPRRARVQVRQVYAFARGASLGWNADEARRLATQGLKYFLTHYRRSDGLFRTLVAADGKPLDDRAFLYDQAFVLLALAESERLLRPGPELIDTARAALGALPAAEAPRARIQLRCAGCDAVTVESAHAPARGGTELDVGWRRCRVAHARR